jgi:hypothetical protein
MLLIVFGVVFGVLSFIESGGPTLFFAWMALTGTLYMNNCNKEIIHTKNDVNLTEDKIAWKGHTAEVKRIRYDCESKLYNLDITKHTWGDFEDTELKVKLRR